MKNDGGPAFSYEHGHSPDGVNVREQGMSLRDWFAGQAVAGFIGLSLAKADETFQVHEVAAVAYKIADAMIEARGD